MRARTITGTRAIALTGTRAMIPSLGGYVGPLDFITVSYSYAFRLLDSAYEGALVRLRRDDDTESDFFAVAGTGIIDTAAIATWLGASDGFGAKWYDHSGNGYDLLQTNSAKQPKFIASHNGNPAFLFDGIDDYLQAVGVDLSQPIEIMQVFQSGAENDGRLFDSKSNTKRSTMWIGVSGGVPKMYANNPIVVGATDVSDVDTHYIFSQLNGASSVIRVDGVEDVASALGTSDMGGLTIGAKFDGNFTHTGHISEFALKDSLFAGGRAALEANVADFFGVE